MMREERTFNRQTHCPRFPEWWHTGVNLAWPSSCVSSKKICSSRKLCFLFHQNNSLHYWLKKKHWQRDKELDVFKRTVSSFLAIGWLAVIKYHWKDYWHFYCRSHKMTFRQLIGNMKTSWSLGGHIPVPASVNKNWPSVARVHLQFGLTGNIL